MIAKTTCSLFVLFAIVAGIGAMAPTAFADHSEITITTSGGNTPGCEETDTCFEPSDATVDVGGTVIMENTETVFTIHTFTSGTIEDNKPMPDDVFHFQLNNGESAEWKPDTVGTYPYYCAVHPWMIGTITVQEAGTEEEEHEEAESMENSDESETPDPKDEEMMKEGEMMMDDDKMMMDDDKMMMDDDKMMMDDDKMMKGGELMAEIDVLGGDTAEAGEQIPIDVTVTMMDNAEGKMIHLWYDLVATQSGETILEVKDGHSHDGKIADLKTNPLLAAPSDDAPIMITVTSQGMAPPLSDGSAPPVEERTGSIGTVISEKQIVPEFGSIAMMILAVAVISIVAVTAKSRIVPRI